MKYVTMIARVLLGLVFLVFGLNKFLNFFPLGPMPAGPAGQFMGALFTTPLPDVPSAASRLWRESCFW